MTVVNELRIHGVGGSSPEKLLGEATLEETVLVRSGVRTALYARHDDPSVQGYLWGDLTSGSKLQPLWILLLPFTLINAAGWMHPPLTGDRRRQRQVHAIRRLVGTLALTLTASWVVWPAAIFADLLSYQGGRHLGALNDVPFWSLTGVAVVLVVAGALRRLLPVVVVGTAVGLSVVSARLVDSARLRAAGGVVLSLVVIATAFAIAAVTRRRYEARMPAGTQPGPARAATDNEDFRSPLFFARPKETGRLLLVHGGVVALVAAVLVARAVSRAASDADSLGFGSSFAALGALQLALLAVLAVVSLADLDRLERRWRVAGPAVAATLSVGLTNATFAGIDLFIRRRLRLSTSSAELALTDVGVITLLATVAFTLVAAIPRFVMTRRSDAPDVADAGWRKRVARRRRMARAFRAIDIPCTVAGALFLGLGSAAGLARLETSGLKPWEWELSTGDLGGVRGLGVVLLAVVVPGVALLIRAGDRSLGARRNIGNLWDVLTIWPRRFHPLGVRPYSEVAVPELQEHIRSHLDGGGGPGVVVSAHSQGTVLAFMALRGMEGEPGLDRVALVTYGSPLSRLHARFFPAYFAPAQFVFLGGMLFDDGDLPAGGWRNFFHRTDHIGQEVFDEVGAPGASADEELPDPATEPVTDPADAGQESDRVPWSGIAGHNDYPREQRLKAWVADVKSRIARRPPGPDP